LIHRVHGACPHDCPDTCGLITEVENDRAVRLYADPDNPVTKGWLCAKVRPYLDHVYHRDRLLHPLRRVGAKGGGQWRQISWTEALTEIADRWRSVIADYGASAILPYSYSGTIGLVQAGVSAARFWNRLGASQLQRSICGAAAELAVESTLGARWSPPVAELEQTNLVILWGHNPVSTAPHFMPALRRAQKRGCQLVVIDPLRTRSAQGANHYLAPLPGSDGWLAMGLAHLLEKLGLHNESWLENHAVGWLALRERLVPFTPERVARKTGLTERRLSDWPDFMRSANRASSRLPTASIGQKMAARTSVPYAPYRRSPPNTAHPAAAWPIARVATWSGIAKLFSIPVIARRLREPST